MKRYLMYFSYIGSGFRGIQRQIPRGQKVINPAPTVAEVIENAFKSRFRLSETPILYTASRTDAGVHALKTSAHIDLDLEGWEPASIIINLNFYFSKISCPIRIISLQRVKDDFNSRALAVKRSYLYRLAINKPNINYEVDPLTTNLFYYLPKPITEYSRCHFIYEPEFNVDAIKEVLPLFIGTRDFRTFMGALHSKKLRSILQADIKTVRELQNIEISPGKPLLPSPIDDYYNYWDITCTSKSFVYKQVRRMVTSLIGVAIGKLKYHDIKYMFDNPSQDNYKNVVPLVPAFGLYLTDIVYNKEDLMVPVEYQKEEEAIIPLESAEIKTNPKDLIGLTINEKINLRNEKIRLEKKLNKNV